jgi:hypothetical protein
MAVWRIGGHPEFFGRRPLESADPEVLRS